MSAESAATSVPVPIAMPRSAWASAAASLTPSPTMATTLPAGLEVGDHRVLVLGAHVGEHPTGRDADVARHGSAAASWSPVSR